MSELWRGKFRNSLTPESELVVTDEGVDIRTTSGIKHLPFSGISEVRAQRSGMLAGFIAFLSQTGADCQLADIGRVVPGLRFNGRGHYERALEAKKLIDARLDDLERAGVISRDRSLERRRAPIDAALARLGGFQRWAARGEIRELPKLLVDGELPERVVEGAYNRSAGLLVVTDRRVLFIDKGFASLRVEDFGFDQITSVQFKTGMVMGEVQMITAGNTATITNVPKAEVRAVADRIRAGISRRGEQSAPRSPSADEIARFAELHRQGVLTDEEFAAKKKQLLGI